MNRIDEIFRQKVGEGIDKLLTERKNRPKAPEGRRYVRDWYDRMSEKSVLNTDYFMKHIPAIWAKKSNLPSEERKIINYVCANANIEALQQVQIEESETQKQSTK